MAFKTVKVDVLGTQVDDISEQSAIQEILRLAGDKRRGHFVATVNSEFVMLARRDPQFRQILDSADLLLPDGMGVVISKRIFGGKVQNRVTGVDLVEKLCRQVGGQPIRVGFLGGFRSVAEIVAQRQKAASPSLKVALAEPGDPTIGSDSRLKKRFGEVGRVDILFVAYGMGPQEEWIWRQRNSLDVGVFIGVGGAFDYLAGVKKRAPKLMRELSLEWLWRLFWEPARAWRMRVLPLFWVLVLRDILSGKTAKN